MRLDVKKSPALSATVQVMTTMPREAAKAVRAYSKAVITPEWKKGLATRSPSQLHSSRLVGPSAAYISDRGVKLVAGSNAAGMFPRETEFGAYREDFNTYRRKGAAVTRRTQRQFWNYTKGGRVVFPTVENIIPRVGALWVQTVYRSVAEVIEKALARG